MDGSAVAREDLPVVRAARTGESVQAEELVVCRASGQEVTTLVNATPIRADDGEIASIVATVQDISPLEELERLRAEFLGMVSHELRAPLAAIKGSAATARGASSPLDPAETRQFFRIIEEQADQMRDLINNLLDLTRIEAGTLSITPRHHQRRCGDRAGEERFLEQRPRQQRRSRDDAGAAPRVGRRTPARAGTPQPPLQRRQMLTEVVHDHGGRVPAGAVRRDLGHR